MSFDFQNIDEHTEHSLCTERDLVVVAINNSLTKRKYNPLNHISGKLYGLDLMYKCNPILIKCVFNIMYKANSHFLNEIDISIHNSDEPIIKDNEFRLLPLMDPFELIQYEGNGTSIYGEMYTTPLPYDPTDCLYTLHNYNIHAILTFIRFLDSNVKYFDNIDTLSFDFIGNFLLPSKDIIINFERASFSETEIKQFIGTILKYPKYFQSIFCTIKSTRELYRIMLQYFRLKTIPLSYMAYNTITERKVSFYQNIQELSNAVENNVNFIEYAIEL